MGNQGEPAEFTERAPISLPHALSKRRSPLLILITPQARFHVSKGRGTECIQFCALLEISVRTELHSLFLGGARQRFVVPKHTLTKAVLEPHQRWNDGHDLGH